MQKFLLPADMANSQTQPRCGPSAQLTEYHVLSVFLWNILMLNLRGAISLYNTWAQVPGTSPTPVVVTLLRAMQLQHRLCSASSLHSLVLSKVIISLTYQQLELTLSPLVSIPKNQVNQVKTRSCISSSLPRTAGVPPRMPAHLRIRQPSLLYPNCFKSQSISHIPGLEIRGKV